MASTLKGSGWTLIELLIALSISSVLICIALPSYQHWQALQARNQAIIQLYTLRNAIEQYHLEQSQWPTQLTALAANLRTSKTYDFSLTQNHRQLILEAHPGNRQLVADSQVVLITLAMEGKCQLQASTGLWLPCHHAGFAL